MNDKNGQTRTAYREILYLIGLPLLGLGVVLIIKSQMGVTAVNSIPFVMRQIWPGISLGIWTYFFQTVLILTLVLLLHTFKKVYVISFAISILFSVFIDLFNYILSFLPPGDLLMRSVYFGSGMLALPIGIALTIFTGLPLMPIDLFVREIATAKKIPFGRLKLFIDLTYVCISVVLLAVFIKRLTGIGIGTLLTASLNGPIAGFWMVRLKARYRLKSLLNWNILTP